MHQEAPSHGKVFRLWVRKMIHLVSRFLSSSTRESLLRPAVMPTHYRVDGCRVCGCSTRTSAAGCNGRTQQGKRTQIIFPAFPDVLAIPGVDHDMGRLAAPWMMVPALRIDWMRSSELCSYHTYAKSDARLLLMMILLQLNDVGSLQATITRSVTDTVQFASFTTEARPRRLQGRPRPSRMAQIKSSQHFGARSGYHTLSSFGQMQRGCLTGDMVGSWATAYIDCFAGTVSPKNAHRNKSVGFDAMFESRRSLKFRYVVGRIILPLDDQNVVGVVQGCAWPQGIVTAATWVRGRGRGRDRHGHETSWKLVFDHQIFRHTLGRACCLLPALVFLRTGMMPVATGVQMGLWQALTAVGNPAFTYHLVPCVLCSLPPVNRSIRDDHASMVISWHYIGTNRLVVDTGRCAQPYVLVPYPLRECGGRVDPDVSATAYCGR